MLAQTKSIHISGELFSLATQTEIDHWLAKFPEDQKRSALLPALMAVQKQNQGSLTVALMDELATYLLLPKIAVYEVATFYSMYELKPVGKHVISVCTNISCMLRGSDEVVQALKDRLGIGFGESTTDGNFTLKEVECLAACGGAPAMMIGLDYFENLNQERINTILDKVLAPAEPTDGQ